MSQLRIFSLVIISDMDGAAFGSVFSSGVIRAIMMWRKARIAIVVVILDFFGRKNIAQNIIELVFKACKATEENTNYKSSFTFGL